MNAQPQPTGYRTLSHESRKAFWRAVALCLLPPVGGAFLAAVIILLLQKHHVLAHNLGWGAIAGIFVGLAILHLIMRRLDRVGLFKVEYPEPGSFRVYGMIDKVTWNA